MRTPRSVPLPRRLTLLSLVCGAFYAASAQVEITPVGNDHVTIQIDGQPFSEFFIGSAYAKPFLAPLRAAEGQIVTRRFPMEQAEGESRDHPHHKGLWIGFGDVNGINFWETEAESKASGSNPKDKGRIVLATLKEAKSGGKEGRITAIFNWLGPSGDKILQEERTIRFYTDREIRRLDFESTFTPDSASVRFGDTKEGFFAIRVADSMAGKNGGVLTNSEGARTEKEVWGRTADWVDYAGPVVGKKLGILILDNPQNPRHPPRWHARDYGLFAVNPFGVTEFDSTARKSSGGYVIARGESAHFRYRVIIHDGEISKDAIAHWYADYAKGK